MTVDEFKMSITNDAIPPIQLNPNLKALWFDQKGNWDKAHSLADGNDYPEADWVHAYLHRKEGDNWNANYWYRRAGKSMPNISLQEEWEQLVAYFLSK